MEALRLQDEKRMEALRKKLYEAVLNKNWKILEEEVSKERDPMCLLGPISMHKDNIIHLAVHSKKKEPLEKILESVNSAMLPSFTNAHGNTVLHEAAICRNFEAVKLLVDKNHELLEKRNDSDETPPFRAAAYGNTKIVKFLAAQPGQRVKYSNRRVQLKSIHRSNKDGDSILVAAIRGQHFGTALELLKLDKTLAELEGESETSLYMLAKLRSVFKSRQEMGMWKKIFYFCVPIGRSLDDSVKKINEDKDSQIDKGLHEGVPIGRSLDDSTEKINEDEDRDLEKGLCEGVPIGRNLNDSAEKINEDEDPHIDKGLRERVPIGLSLDDNAEKINEDEDRDIEKGLREGVPISRNLDDSAEKINEGEDPYIDKGLREGVPIDRSLDDSTEKINENEDRDIEKGLCKGLPTAGVHAIEEQNGEGGPIYKVLYKIYVSFWNMLVGWSVVHNLLVEKRGYDLACKLARILIENDKSWDQSDGDKPPDEVENEGEGKAITTGNEELVKLILEQHPQALEYINDKKQNILHLAVMYRQKEIFNLVRNYEIPMLRLAREIDSNGYTILHSVADMTHYKGGKRSGPAYQLQEELQWFYNVEAIMPRHYTMLLAAHNKNKCTPWEVLVKDHDGQHKEAKKWIKDTTQSCSTVAVLVATAVFAAAFNVPGGTDSRNGSPVLINRAFFLFFTTADIVALSSSLTAIVMFLAILTSPLELKSFHTTLPTRLTIGFALLFVSVATTMLAFASTIFLVIRLDQRQRWTTTLICSAAFLPVGLLALTQFPLFPSFVKVWKFFLNKFITKFFRTSRT